MIEDVIGTVRMINADCMDVLVGMPDKSFDLAIVDPPYGIGEDGSKNHQRGLLANPTKFTPKNWDAAPPEREYFDELIRVSKNQIIFGANHFISRIPYDSSCWIVWDKDNGSTNFADYELACTSFKTAVRKFKYRWNGMLQENMKNKEKRIHPTQKPVRLYEWLLMNYAKQGDRILDTHNGSGSINIACDDLGFDLTAIELDSEYYQAAKKRLIDFKRQLKLF